uniref:Uncharacterized protein n=1 Tax=Rhizophora mucronata TaxID=61149 RepID=A0A2P2JF64_RHIMU
MSCAQTRTCSNSRTSKCFKIHSSECRLDILASLE